MKKSIALALSLVAFWLRHLDAMAGDPQAGLKISDVVVYPDRARVTRTSKVACGKAISAEFVRIPPSADPATIRAEVEGGTLDGLRWEVRTSNELFGHELRTIETDMRTLNDKISLQQETIRRLQTEQHINTSFAAFSHNAASSVVASPGSDLKDYIRALAALRERDLKFTQTLHQANVELRRLQEDAGELQQKAQQMRQVSGSYQHYDGYVVVSCQPGQSATVSLNYMVGGAAWTPSYEARVNESERQVSFRTFATVTQVTGEDWSQAKIALSTAVPRQNATPPEIRSLDVSAIKREAPKKQIVERLSEVRNAPGASSTETENPSENFLAVSQGLSVQLRVPGLSTIRGDGTPSRLNVGESKLKTQFHYRATPKLVPAVFLVGEMTNSLPYPILPGSVDVFRGNSFVARLDQERVPQGQIFAVTLGVEDNLKVRHEVIKQSEKATGLVSKTNERHYAHRFYISNYLRQAANIEIKDQIPVSELDDVKVVVDYSKTKGFNLDKDDGILTWNVYLKPNESKEIELAYRIDVPGDYL